MDEESKSTKQFASGWSLFAVPVGVKDFFRKPPTWFSAPILLSGFLLVLGSAGWLVWQLIWLLFTFLSAVSALSSFANTGTRPETADALKHIIAATGGVLGGIIATALVIWRTWLSQRQTKTVEEQRLLAEQTHYTTLFTKAVEQLGSMVEEKSKNITTAADGRQTGQEIIRMVPNLPVRLGAIYSLERIAHDSFRDHWPIIETLCAYVRQESRIEKLESPRVDIQAAITAIGKRREEWKNKEPQNQALDLRNSWLRGIEMAGLDFSRSLLFEAEISNSDLSYAKFNNCHFFKTNVSNSNFMGSKLNNCTFRISNLSKTSLDLCELKKSVAFGTDFRESTFAEADFLNSDFSDSNFGGCNLLNVKNLTQEHINSMAYDKPSRVPKDLIPKPEWLEQEKLEEEMKQIYSDIWRNHNLSTS